MGRYSANKAYNHKCRDIGGGLYRIQWTIDYYSKGSRLRNPVVRDSTTDLQGAKRFCKKHNLPAPDLLTIEQLRAPSCGSIGVAQLSKKLAKQQS